MRQTPLRVCSWRGHWNQDNTCRPVVRLVILSNMCVRVMCQPGSTQSQIPWPHCTTTLRCISRSGWSGIKEVIQPDCPGHWGSSRVEMLVLWWKEVHRLKGPGGHLIGSRRCRAWARVPVKPMTLSCPGNPSAS